MLISPPQRFSKLLNIELWFEPYNQSILKHDFSVKAVPLDLQGIPITFFVSPSLTLLTIVKVPISSKKKPLRMRHLAGQTPALHPVEAYVHPHLATVNQGLDSWLESTETLIAFYCVKWVMCWPAIHVSKMGK
ncbi:hypothetical protein ASPBRDRAFT_604008 [Aspergillus brasiliensis CBS 101740]|uniref:Uncharacterized protein n=1 Tax=Aspergillus brasiliensis (strain CBS 101740 / IMI 381727 / IBT 21946) TaxID=767769 RepID=A0A1L9UHL9_ASPBC|nr:hypothetical protein ASPBRDRAFT_604008 [Aspergillus brasiliensis CBS 101740]